MAPPNRFPLPTDTHNQMRDTIENIWRIVTVSRQSIVAAQEAIARADKVLARRLSERNIP